MTAFQAEDTGSIPVTRSKIWLFANFPTKKSVKMEIDDKQNYTNEQALNKPGIYARRNNRATCRARRAAWKNLPVSWENKKIFFLDAYQFYNYYNFFYSPALGTYVCYPSTFKHEFLVFGRFLILRIEAKYKKDVRASDMRGIKNF